MTRKNLIAQLEGLLFRVAVEDRQIVRNAIDALTITERTPQKQLHAALVALGVDAEMEVTLPARSAMSKSGTFRADIAVRRDGQIVALAECKAWGGGRVLAGRQHENYETSGYPYIVAGHDNLDAALAWLVAKSEGR